MVAGAAAAQSLPTSAMLCCAAGGDLFKTMLMHGGLLDEQWVCVEVGDGALCAFAVLVAWTLGAVERGAPQPQASVPGTHSTAEPGSSVHCAAQHYAPPRPQ